MLNPQLDRRGELIHLLTTEGLPRRHVERLLDMAARFADGSQPAAPAADLPLFLSLPAGDIDLRQGFEAAAGQLGLRPVPLAGSAGVDAGVDRGHGVGAGDPPSTHAPAAPSPAAVAAGLPAGILVLRHPASGAAVCAAGAQAPGLRIINAGDGAHADPLPALARVQVMLRAKRDLTNLAVALVGDIRHSAVARSLIHAMTTLGVPEVRATAPRTLLPDGLPQLGVRACGTLRECLADADVVIVLPLRAERMSGALLPSARDYTAACGLTPARLAGAKADVLLLPAGGLTPGIEIDGDIGAGLPDTEASLARSERDLRLAALSVLAGGAA
ncbi:aspartate carbamoyltransferase [Achromobacter xylosoxidans]|uniref:aspartate carbamoyltransferase n=2 Tax=Alcaligenes xylosoxydans xylosoxydans TaxID=85698 RepID=UPI000D1B70C3|nr:aspartate carbamoyltransferase [Achromobacter xylosoxidans]MCH1987514.1 aspartate carbamoyltransferase [Achromobacter xylosoxidans]